MTTKELDLIAENQIRSMGAIPAFKGYRGFPGTLCISINDEIVHGIPGDRIFQEGDVVSIDQGAIVEGFYSDTAITLIIGESDERRSARCPTSYRRRRTSKTSPTSD